MRNDQDQRLGQHFLNNYEPDKKDSELFTSESSSKCITIIKEKYNYSESQIADILLEFASTKNDNQEIYNPVEQREIMRERFINLMGTMGI